MTQPPQDKTERAYVASNILRSGIVATAACDSSMNQLPSNGMSSGFSREKTRWDLIVYELHTLVALYPVTIITGICGPSWVILGTMRQRLRHLSVSHSPYELSNNR